jgi:hypothetical protein
MPLYISLPKDCITSIGPGKKTRGKMPASAITAHSATTGTNGTSAASAGQRAVQRT